MRKCYSLLVILAITLSGYSQQMYSLKECLTYALKNSHQAKQRTLDTQKSQQEVEKAKSHYLPKVSAFTQYRQYFDLPTYIFSGEAGQIISSFSANENLVPVELGADLNFDAGIRLIQPVFDGKWLSAKEGKAHLAKLQELLQEKSEEEIIFAVASQFYQTTALQEQTTVIDFNLDRLTRLIEVVELQRASGLAKASDVDRLKLSQMELLGQKQKLEGGIRQQLALLKFLMGMPLEEQLLVKANLDNIESTSAKAPNNQQNTASQLLNEQIALNSIEQQQIQASYLPKANFTANVQFQAQRDEFNFFNGNQEWFGLHWVSLGVDIPIFSGFEKKSRLALADTELKELQLKQQQNEEGLTLKYEQAKEAVSSAQNGLESSRLSSELSERLMNSAQQEYDQGVITLRELLDTQAENAQAKSNVVQALYDLKIAILNMLTAQGNLKVLLEEN